MEVCNFNQALNEGEESIATNGLSGRVSFTTSVKGVAAVVVSFADSDNMDVIRAIRREQNPRTFRFSRHLHWIFWKDIDPKAELYPFTPPILAMVSEENHYECHGQGLASTWNMWQVFGVDGLIAELRNLQTR